MWISISLLLLLVALAVVASVLLRHAEPYVRARIVNTLRDRFHARVELDSFHVSLINGLWAEGKGLRIWPPAPSRSCSRGPRSRTALSS